VGKWGRRGGNQEWGIRQKAMRGRYRDKGRVQEWRGSDSGNVGGKRRRRSGELSD